MNQKEIRPSSAGKICILEAKRQANCSYPRSRTTIGYLGDIEYINRDLHLYTILLAVSSSSLSVRFRPRMPHSQTNAWHRSALSLSSGGNIAKQDSDSYSDSSCDKIVVLDLKCCPLKRVQFQGFVLPLNAKSSTNDA